MISDSDPEWNGATRDPAGEESSAPERISTGREPAPRIIRRDFIPARGGRSFGAPAFSEVPPPDGIEALYYEGMAAYQHRNWEEALDRFTRLKELQPTRPGLDALLEEVRWFLQLQNAAPAKSRLVAETDNKGGRRRPWRGSGWQRRWRASLYIVVAALAVAVLLLVAFEDRLPWGGNRAAEDLFNRGQARLAVGDYEGAQAAFAKMLKVSPGDPEGQLGLERAKRQQTLAQGYAAAEAAIAEEDWARAGTELAAILAVDLDFRDAGGRADFVSQRARLAELYAEGGRLYDLGQWEEALDQFEKIRDTDATYRTETVGEFLFVCYLNAGEELLKTAGGGFDGANAAVEYFGKALAIHPRNRTASDARRLGQMYVDALQALARDDSERARSHLSALVSESPAYAGGQAARRLYELLVVAGQHALAAGNVPSALQQFDRAQELPVEDTSAAGRGVALARAATPTASPTARNTATSTAVPTPWASVPRGPVNVRSGPGDAYPTVGELAQDAKVPITGRREDGAWLRVCCTAKGMEGWVSSPLLQVTGPLKKAAVVTLPAATVTQVPATATQTLPSPTRAPKSTGTPEPSVCVEGNVLNVAGGQGLSGWIVRVVDASGVEKTWHTKESGFYRFGDLQAGSTTVTVDVPAGWRAVSPLPASLIAAPGEACVNVDIWAEKADSGSGSEPSPEPTPLR